jgi:hypothetical protein
MPNENYGKGPGWRLTLAWTALSAFIAGFGTHEYYQDKISDMEFDQKTNRMSRALYNRVRINEIAKEYLERGDTCSILDYMWDVCEEVSTTCYYMGDDEVEKKLDQYLNEE